MKTNTTSEFLTGKISEGLKKAQQEIEEFAVQISLGKAESAEKFEELKKEFYSRMNEWKPLLSNMKSAGAEKATALLSAIEDIQVQLALGKADAKDFITEQKEKLLHSIHHFETELKANPQYKERLNEFRSETEKFKLKLEILEMRFELKTLEGKDKFKKAMASAGIEIEKLLKNAEEKWDDARKKSSDFSDEIAISFDHIKKAVKSLRNGN